MTTSRHQGLACRLASVALLCLAASGGHAATVLFGNFDPDAIFEPTNGLNIWSACSGRAVPFTVSEAGYLTQVQFPIGNWGVADRGNLIIEVMLDYGAVVPGLISAPDPAAVVESVTRVVTDWAGTHQRQFSIDFSGATLLQPGTIYWLALSLDKVVPVGIPGLTWWGNIQGQAGPTASRSGMPPAAFWYPSRFDDTNALRILGTSVVPLPGSAWLLATALGGLAAVWRRR
jgi:hypothetical protein